MVPAEVQDDQSLGLVQHLLEFYDLSAFVFVCVLLLFMFLVSHLVWLAERHSGSKMFSDRYLQGVDDGMWWSITTMTTVGYGDKVGSSVFALHFFLSWSCAKQHHCHMNVQRCTHALCIFQLHGRSVDVRNLP